MVLWQVVHIYFLLLGSLGCLVLGKLILRFYSTIIFTDRNIFTYLNIASTVSLVVLVQTRVGTGWALCGVA